MGDTTADLTEAQSTFLRERPHAIVATIMKDGRPQLTPNWYLWDGERFWVSTLDWTVKVKNAKRDPRITLCIDGPGRRTNYVQVFGTAEVVEGDVREHTLDLDPQVRDRRGGCPGALGGDQGRPRPHRRDPGALPVALRRVIAA